MLELNKITKIYKTNDASQRALDNVSLKFRKKEFVCILGPSGSGKTTLLNIIGGLDNYSDGNLIINGKSTKKFREKDFDFYRNNLIGFVFQNYNLINHVSVYKNVEMALLLNSTKKNKRQKLVLDALKKVGLENHINKKPNELSGGQMQRVAIARALVNNPDIILADEPTGALDSKTSIQIMELIKNISKDKLVIMVTHNDVLAKKYANRIIKLEDGRVINDTNPLNRQNNKDIYKIKKTKMSFLSAIYLSFNNIKTKLKRTILTCFASSIGIIGIALILSISNGFNSEINEYQKDTMSSFPIGITSEVIASNDVIDIKDNKLKKDVLYMYDDKENSGIHINKITEDYINYVKNINKDYLSGISYHRIINLNLMSTNGISYKIINPGSISFKSLPNDENKKGYLKENYDLLSGEYPKDDMDVVLMVDDFNKIDETFLNALFLGGTKEVSFDRILGKELRVIKNDDYYLEENKNNFIKNSPSKEIYNKSDITLKIVGIIKRKTDDETLFKEGVENSSKAVIGYQNALIERIINQNTESKIVKAQENSNGVVFMGNISFEDAGITKKQALVMLGKKDLPVGLNIYSNGFNNKDRVIKLLDEYNKYKCEEDKIIYTDYAKEISDTTHNIMNGITIVLVVFSSISLVVSSLMIGIITYISVLERAKEIGILRSLGARRKDISRVFNAETLLIGLTSGIIGVGITKILLFPINAILYNLTDLKKLGILSYKHAIILILVSVILTLIGGFIPSVKASFKKPIEALRNE